MERIGTIILIVVVVLVGMWLLQIIGSGNEALITAPVRAVGKTRGKRRAEAEVTGVRFQTHTPADQLQRAWSTLFHKGDFHPAHRVIVQTDQPGHLAVQFTLACGVSVAVVEIVYSRSGPTIIGTMRMTLLPLSRDAALIALPERIYSWCFAPIAALDPSTRLCPESPSTPPDE